MAFSFLPLNGGLVAILDEDDYLRAVTMSWCATLVGKKWYVYNAQTKTTLHHFVMGKPKDGEMIDHINGLTVDCRKGNLRFVTPKQNAQNSVMKNSNKTGIKGVTRSGSRFRARIRHPEKGRIELGIFATAEEAGIAYATASRNFHGEFSNTKREL